MFSTLLILEVSLVMIPRILVAQEMPLAIKMVMVQILTRMVINKARVKGVVISLVRMDKMVHKVNRETRTVKDRMDKDRMDKDRMDKDRMVKDKVKIMV